MSKAYHITISPSAFWVSIASVHGAHVPERHVTRNTPAAPRSYCESLFAEANSSLNSDTHGYTGADSASISSEAILITAKVQAAFYSTVWSHYLLYLSGVAFKSRSKSIQAIRHFQTVKIKCQYT